MRKNLTSGLVVLGLQALAASASAQGYYYPAPMPYPAHMYNPALYPTPQAAARAEPAPRGDRPPEGILPALMKLAGPKPVSAAVDAAPLTDAAPPAPVVAAPAAPCENCGGPPLVSEPAPQPAGWRVYGLGGVSLLRANIRDRDAFRVLSSDVAVNGANVVTRNAVTTESFDPGLELSPLVILVTGENGYGVRGRFWYYQESDTRTATNADATGARTAVTSVLPAPFTVVSSAGGADFLPGGTGGGALASGVGPDQIVATHDFKATVVDLEATSRSEADGWAFTGGVGVRYGYLEQRYGFTRVNAGGTAAGVTFLTDTEASTAEHRFEGVGPAVSAEVSRGLGVSGLSLYGLGRGALLIGRHRFRADTRAVVLADAGGAIATDTLTSGASGSTRVVPVGELELGAQWARPLGGVTVVARAGFQVQTWLDAGDLTTTAGNVDFYGGNFLLGLTY